MEGKRVKYIRKERQKKRDWSRKVTCCERGKIYLERWGGDLFSDKHKDPCNPGHKHEHKITMYK
jgi:hypothetical protein